MTSEQKVKQVYPDTYPAVWYGSRKEELDRFFIMRRGCNGPISDGCMTIRGAWINAWGRIQAERKAEQ